MWLHVPSEVLPSAPVSEGSISPSASPWASTIALCVTSSGKPTLRPLSWRGWRTRPWIRLLCGTTCSPSTLDAGVERWISSLRDTPASPSALPANCAARRTPDTSGPASGKSSPNADPAGSSSRTSPTICGLEATRSPETFSAWGTALRAHCGRRRKQALRTSASGCSSWPTAKVSSGAYSYIQGNHSKPVLNLEGAAKAWPTPAASVINDGEPLEKWEERRQRNLAKHVNGNGHGTPLTIAAQAWATPTSRDWKDGADPSAEVETNSLLGRQAPRSGIGGAGSSSDGRDSRRLLNPNFVDWLMGYPPGWTGCAPLGTEFARRRLQMRSLNWLSRWAVDLARAGE